MMLRHCLYLLFTFFPPLLYAQTTENTVSKAISINYGFIKNSFSAKINYQYYTSYHTFPYLQDESLTIQHHPFTQISHVEAYTLKEQKKMLAMIQKPQNILQENVFYDDTQSQKITFVGLEKGATTFLQYTEECTTPHLPLRLYLTGKHYTKNWQVVIHVPKHITISYELLGINKEVVKVQSQVNPTSTTYTLTAQNLPSQAHTVAQSALYTLPQLIVYVSTVHQTQILGTIRNLYDWYYSISKEKLYQSHPQLQLLADSLTQHIPNDSLKAVRLLTWVQKKIRYIAFEDAWGGYIPRSPYDTYRKQYGDCKDIANLLATLARLAGLKAHFAWIGTRVLPYTYSRLPLPLADNHAIVVFETQAQTFFVDATSPYTVLHLPNAQLQGQEALVAIDSSQYALRKVPVSSPLANQQIDSLQIEVATEQWKITGNSTFNGLYEVQSTEQRKQKQVYWFETLTPTATVEWSAEGRWVATAHYQALLPSKATAIGTDVYLPVFFMNTPFGLITQENMYGDSLLLQASFPFIHTIIMDWQLPQGFRWEHLPANQTINLQKYCVEIIYEQLSSQRLRVRSTSIFTDLGMSVTKIQWQLFSQQLRQIKQQYLSIAQE